MRPEHVTRPRLRALAVAALCAAGVALVYLVALGTDRGLAWDAVTLGQGLRERELPRVHAATALLVGTIDVGSIVLFGLGAVALSLARRRADAAAAVVVLVTGANVSTQLLKPALGRWDVLGGDADRRFEGAFPSGHATVAMSLALAFVLAAPRSLGVLAAVLGASYAAGIGVALIVLASHYPSDVAGAYLLTAAWASAASLLLRRRAEATVETRSVLGWLAALVAAAAAASALALAIRPGISVHIELNTHLAASALVLSALAAAVTFGVLGLLRR